MLRFAGPVIPQINVVCYSAHNLAQSSRPAFGVLTDPKRFASVRSLVATCYWPPTGIGSSPAAITATHRRLVFGARRPLNSNLTIADQAAIDVGFDFRR